MHVQVFEKGNFAGLDEMKKNERLFQRVAPMGVADIALAVQYKHGPHAPEHPLPVPITCFEGMLDGTIDPGNMSVWAQYTSGRFQNVPVMGDHYFVSSCFRAVTEQVARQLLDIMDEQLQGGVLGEAHSWV